MSSYPLAIRLRNTAARFGNTLPSHHPTDKMRFATLITSVMAVAMPAVRAATPASPGLTYLYTANVTLGTSFSMGVGPQGERVAIPIVGGTFSGPNINGVYPKAWQDGQVAVEFVCWSLTLRATRKQAPYWTWEPTGAGSIRTITRSLFIRIRGTTSARRTGPTFTSRPRGRHRPMALPI